MDNYGSSDHAGDMIPENSDTRLDWKLGNVIEYMNESRLVGHHVLWAH